MTNAFSVPGLISALLLLICAAAFARRSPSLRSLFLSDKKGTAYKMSVIGKRLHVYVSASCFVMSLWLLFFR
jgi:hypothetical protein